MRLIKQKFIKRVLILPRGIKQIIALLCDFSLCLISVVLAFYLRLDQIFYLNGPAFTAAWISVCIALPVFWFFGLYRIIFRYSGSSIIFLISNAFLVYGLLYISIFTFYRIENIPRSIGIIQPMLLFFGVVSSRLYVKYFFEEVSRKRSGLLKATLIYGAGSAGRQLSLSLENNSKFKIIGFLDDDIKLQDQVIQGYNVYSTDELDSLIQSNNIKIILLALPSISRFKRNQILKKFLKFKIIVQTLPSVSEIIEGKVTMSDIKELNINDVLDREPIPPKKELMLKNVESQVVMVTGAGGSIGSEICRQIIKCKPKMLILCEINEFALYSVYNDLKTFNKDLKIISLLINIQDEKKIIEILKIFKVDTIYHAAAYKHVPLVEENICESILNNVFATFSIAKAAIDQSVSNFVLISSDKAVRPTNVMGATKRLAELCVKALYHHNQNTKINMSMVRFGNVLESSGSVIPKFKKQIKEGGPVTLTHSEVTRYFMTITEAAQLVIQAGAMSKECDVFILDMGKSVKIKDLIYHIVSLSGLSIKDKENPEGDIEIVETGLRPGEKLYEELLMGNDPQTTNHEKIKKAQDPFIFLDELEKKLAILKLLVVNHQTAEAKLMMEKIVTTYKSDYEIVDHIHSKKKELKI
tara:strand:- start:4268 stop:6190 length:1923 start_codon:yes stop_codon:yes gene_type:complete